MKQLEQQFEVYVENLKTLLLQLKPIHLAAIGSFFILLLLIRIIRRSARRRKLQKIAPRLGLDAFQIAPLGRDAFLKVKNSGDLATLSGLAVKGRKDISIKNAVAGHQLEKDKVYSILMEADSNNKIRSDFSIELTYLDRNGNVYRQAFLLDRQQARKPKLLKVAKV